MTMRIGEADGLFVADDVTALSDEVVVARGQVPDNLIDVLRLVELVEPDVAGLVDQGWRQLLVGGRGYLTWVCVLRT